MNNKLLLINITVALLLLAGDNFHHLAIGHVEAGGFLASLLGLNEHRHEEYLSTLSNPKPPMPITIIYSSQMDGSASDPTISSTTTTSTSSTSGSITTVAPAIVSGGSSDYVPFTLEPPTESPRDFGSSSSTANAPNTDSSSETLHFTLEPTQPASLVTPGPAPAPASAQPETANSPSLKPATAASQPHQPRLSASI